MTTEQDENDDNYEVLSNLIGSYFTVFVMSTLVQLKIHDQLKAGPLDDAALAERVGAVPSRLSRILHAAEIYGLVELTDQGWQSTPLLDALTDPTEPNAAAVIYLTSEPFVVPFSHMTDVAKGASDAFTPAHEMSMWQFMETRTDLGDNFEVLLSMGSLEEAQLINSKYSFFKSDGLLCDVGGGSGGTLEILLNSNPGLKGALIDLPAPIERARQRFEGTPLKSKVELVPGDMFAGIPVAADYYLIKNTLHNWGDDKCVQLLRNISAAAPDGARLIVCEYEYDEADLSPDAAWGDLQVMMLCEEGRERSGDEIKALMREAGIKPNAAYNYAPGKLLIEGIL